MPQDSDPSEFRARLVALEGENRRLRQALRQGHHVRRQTLQALDRAARTRHSLRLEAIGQLTAGVAHDFNNLLQAMMANLEMVGDDGDVPPAALEKIQSALHIAEQAAALTQQLLSFARKQLLSPRNIILSEFLDRLRRLLCRSLDPSIRIDLVTESGLGAVRADPKHLRNALMNIASNARDAMPDGGCLRIEASSQPAIAASHVADGNVNAFAVIRVSDTGRGIPKENLSRVCEPFFSTKGLNGTGLGLSMVYGFVKQSGGDIQISSEAGKGTCVEVRLPLVAPLAGAEAGSAELLNAE
jgi:signal transduction histidine kinase